MASKRTEGKLGTEFRKIQPKLRMFAKATDDVNAIRSDFASSLRVRLAIAKVLIPDAEESRLCGFVPTRKLKTLGDCVSSC